MSKVLTGCLCWFWLWAAVVRADLTIEITQGVEGAIPVAVSPFSREGAAPLPVDVAAVIRADLARSGRFAVLPESDMLTRPKDPETVNWSAWQTLGQDYLVIGAIDDAGPAGQYGLRFYLLDVFRKQKLADYRILSEGEGLRQAAHRIADILYEKITGEPGAFATRIAYVTVSEENGRRLYRLQIADADGYRPRTVVVSPAPLMSPAWSPDGQKIAYVSFERRRPTVFVQTLATGEREPIAAFPGINGAPAWSPDGRYLALTLSKDGSPDIYVLNLTTRQLRRLTRSFAIDTEPAWSPDGKRLVFTSDRGGSPQIYVISASGGHPRRLTFEGAYNARAVFSPDGRKLALVHGGEGYRIAVLDLVSGRMKVLTPGPLDETPSFAPNGRMILYATQVDGQGRLVVVSVDGRARQRLATGPGDVREPAWSPF